MEGVTIERLSEGISLAVSREHRFGIDSFLLADFAGDVRGKTVCDLCSGCGIVAALLLRQRDTAPLRAVAVEIDENAVELMDRTVELSALQDRLIPLCGDLKEIQSPLLPSGGFSAVTCNPPYKALGSGIESATAEKRLARHETGCTIEDVCKTAGRLLSYRGSLSVTLRPERLSDTITAMKKFGLEPKVLRQVQKRPETSPWLMLLTARRGCKPFLNVLPPLIVEDESGGYSEEIKRIYRLYSEGEEGGR